MDIVARGPPPYQTDQNPTHHTPLTHRPHRPRRYLHSPQSRVGLNSPTSRITSPQDVEIDSRAEVMEVGTEDIIV